MTKPPRKPRNPTSGPNGGPRPGAGRKRTIDPKAPSVAFAIRLPADVVERLRAIDPDIIRAALIRLAARK